MTIIDETDVAVDLGPEVTIDSVTPTVEVDLVESVTVLELHSDELSVEVTSPTITVDMFGVGSGDGASTIEQIVVTGIAGEDLSGHRIVIRDEDGFLTYADAATVAHAARPFRLTTGATPEGDEAHVVAIGEVEESSWSWPPGGLLFVGLAGQITMTPPAFPTAAFLMQIGNVISPTCIYFDPKTPVILS